MSDDDSGFFRTLAGYATARARHAKDRWLADSPQTYYSAGGTGDYQWQGQAVDRDELKQVKQIRETGGMVAQLYHAKALIRFGTGAELQAEDDALESELADLFPSLDNLVLDLGEDAIWYPYALAEPIETNGSGFSHYECVEPWTTVPRTDDHGEIIAWEHEVNRNEQVFMPDELAHITVNKSSGRDTVGISDVLRSEDEITQYKENQRAINHAIELAGFPHNVWQVGAEGKAPVSDNELRRVRNIVQDPAGDTQWVMGSDIDITQIQPGEFDFQSITERDLRMLTGAIGLPFELVGYGSDGLGSGNEAELKMNLLAIQNEADRRRFAEQFVDRFVRPVVERYTAFSPDEEITLHIEPFLDDKSELAEWIETAGDYLRNEDVVARLGLPPIEDDEVAESYRPPKQIEEAEEEDDAAGGVGGFFSDAAESAVDSALADRELGRDTDFRRLQSVPDNANPIDSPDECGGSVVRGPQGGMYCVPAGEGGGVPDGGDREPGDEIPIDEMEPGDEVSVDATIDTVEGEVDISDDVVEIRVVNENGMAIDHPEYGTQTIPADDIESVTEPEAGAEPDADDGAAEEVGADNPASDVEGAVSQAIDAVNFDDTVGLPESDGDEVILSPDQSDALETALSEAVNNADIEATADDVEFAYDQTQEWKTSSYNDAAQTTERMIAAATGISDNYRNDTLEGREPTEGEVQAMEAIVDAARSFARDEYGDDETVSRGISEQASVGFMADFLGDAGLESTEVNENTVANYSVSDDVATGFSGGGIVIERSLDPEEIVGAPDLVQNNRATRHAREGEVWLPGGQDDVSMEQVTLQTRDGDSVSVAQMQEEGLDNLSEESLTVLAKPIDAMIGPAQAGDLSLDDEQRQSLERIRDRAEDAGIESTMLNVEDVLEAA